MENGVALRAMIATRLRNDSSKLCNFEQTTNGHRCKVLRIERHDVEMRRSYSASPHPGSLLLLIAAQQLSVLRHFFLKSTTSESGFRTSCEQRGIYLERQRAAGSASFDILHRLAAQRLKSALKTMLDIAMVNCCSTQNQARFFGSCEPIPLVMLARTRTFQALPDGASPVSTRVFCSLIRSTSGMPEGML